MNRTAYLKNRMVKQRGSVLLLALFAVLVLSLVVGSYMESSRAEFSNTHRNLYWTEALTLAEAGAEIAISHIQSGDWTGWTYDSGEDAYTYTAGPAFDIEDANGNVIGTAEVIVTNVSTNRPIVTSTGYRTVDPGDQTIMRTVRVYIGTGSSTGSGAINAKQNIDFNGNDVLIDSYNSLLGTYASQKPPGSDHANENGTINTLSSSSTAIVSGNSDVWGDANTAPGGQVTVGPQGFISGTIAHELSGSLADVEVPSGFPAASTLSFPGGKNPTVTLTGSTNPNNPTKFHYSSISMSGNQTLNISGYAQILVDGALSQSGSATINLAANSGLEVYIGGAVSVAGNGVVNATGNPHNLTFFGTNSSSSITDWSISGNGQWNGIIYAPNSNLTFNGGGNNGDAYGAMGANSITFNGHTKFHFDESLQIPGIVFGGSYSLIAWEEVLPPIASPAN